MTNPLFNAVQNVGAGAVRKTLRIGYVPFAKDYHPFDLRNFVCYARHRHLDFEIYRPGGVYDVIVLAPNVDVTRWKRFARNTEKIVFMLVDSYLAGQSFDLRSFLRGAAKFFSGEHKYPEWNYRASVTDLCRRADAVVCSTEEQKVFIKPFCPNAHVILEFNQHIATEVKTQYSLSSPVNLVWEGRPENIGALAEIKDVLIALNKVTAVSLHVLTDLSYGKFMGKFGRTSVASDLTKIFGSFFRPNTVSGRRSGVYLYQWNPQMVPKIIASCDIAVIPLNPRNALLWGKPENKLLLFWRMGVPAVTSATPAYVRAMDKAGLSLTCRDKKDWMDQLRRLIENEPLRRQAGQKGLQAMETHYCLENYYKRWDDVIESVCVPHP